jgi:predicted Rossmann-fold nucleotide-binding protein
MDATDFDRAAAEVASKLPPSFRVAIIGSTSFWHPDSEETCSALGRVLAYMRDLALVTGGVGGVGDTVARRFWDSREGKDGDRGLFHVLPLGYGPRKVGRTLFAGADMAERREILGRLADLYVVIEGGPGTVHEASVALARAAGVLPVGRSGGHSAELHRELIAAAQNRPGIAN